MIISRSRRINCWGRLAGEHRAATAGSGNAADPNALDAAPRLIDTSPSVCRNSAVLATGLQEYRGGDDHAYEGR